MLFFFRCAAVHNQALRWYTASPKMVALQPQPTCFLLLGLGALTLATLELEATPASVRALRGTLLPAPSAARGGDQPATVPGPTQLFSSNMVLQQSATRPAVVHGFAERPSAAITVRDDSEHHPQREYRTVAAPTGLYNWSVQLRPYAVPAQGDPNNFTLTVMEDGAVRAMASNVAYGEVLLCSGQSNMEFSIASAYRRDAILAAAPERPDLRLFQVPQAANATPQARLPAATRGWVLPTAPGLLHFSAICYLTGDALQQSHRARGRRVVYGLVESAIGSTDVQSWMSSSSRAQALRTCWLPTASALPPSHSESPKVPAGGTAASWLWNAMINPLWPFEVGAVVWDQGENNANYCSRSQYNCLFAAMITSWRDKWANTALPFGFVQLGGFDRGDKHDQSFAAGSQNMTVTRFSQSDTLPADSPRFTNDTGSRVAVAATCMAVTYDLGSPCAGHVDPNVNSTSHWCIHCRNKTEVARRLALQLLSLQAPSSAHVATDRLNGDTVHVGSEWSGPVVNATSRAVDAAGFPHVHIAMGHAAGLALRPAQGCIQCCNNTPRTRTTPYLFEVANRKGRWLAAAGAVLQTAEGPIVEVTPLTNVTCARADDCWVSAVRYAVLDIPQCALYNTAELPAAPFQFPVPWGVPPGRPEAAGL